MAKDHDTTRRGRWRSLQNQELLAFLQTLFDLNHYRSPKREVREEGCPVWLYNHLWNKGTELELKNPGMSVAKYIAERFIPRAEAKFAELQAEERHDFRWTRPDPVKAFAKFEGESETPAQALKRFVGKGTKLKIVKPWKWIDVDELPSAVFEENVSKGGDIQGKKNTRRRLRRTQEQKTDAKITKPKKLVKLKIKFKPEATAIPSPASDWAKRPKTSNTVKDPRARHTTESEVMTKAKSRKAKAVPRKRKAEDSNEENISTLRRSARIQNRARKIQVL